MEELLQRPVGDVLEHHAAKERGEEDLPPFEGGSSLAHGAPQQHDGHDARAVDGAGWPVQKATVLPASLDDGAVGGLPDPSHHAIHDETYEYLAYEHVDVLSMHQSSK